MKPEPVSLSSTPKAASQRPKHLDLAVTFEALLEHWTPYGKRDPLSHVRTVSPNRKWIHNV